MAVITHILPSERSKPKATSPLGKVSPLFLPPKVIFVTVSAATMVVITWAMLVPLAGHHRPLGERRPGGPGPAGPLRLPSRSYAEP